jgi:hypothetical protein
VVRQGIQSYDHVWRGKTMIANIVSTVHNNCSFFGIVIKTTLNACQFQ